MVTCFVFLSHKYKVFFQCDLFEHETNRLNLNVSKYQIVFLFRFHNNIQKTATFYLKTQLEKIRFIRANDPSNVVKVLIHAYIRKIIH